MSYYKLYIWLMIINSFVSLTNKLITSAIPAGKIVGFLQIIVLLIIYSTNLKKKDILFLFYMFTVDAMILMRMKEAAIDLENAMFLTSTCLLLWKFSGLKERIVLRTEIASMGKKFFYAANFLLLIVCVGLVFSSNWVVVNGQRVYFGFGESGHKLSGNLCLIGTMYLCYFENKEIKLMDLLYFLVPFALLSLTGSRTYMASYMVILVVFYFKKLRTYKFRQLIMPCLLIGMIYFLLNSSIAQRFFLMGENHYISDNFWEATSSGRLIWWKIDIDSFLNATLWEKLFGRGFTFLYNLNLRLYGLKISAHNDFITLLLSTGLVGVIGYCIVLKKWLFKTDIEGKIVPTTLALVTIMYLWNAMISGVYGAQQYMNANVFLSLALLNPVSIRKKRYGERKNDGRTLSVE